MTCRRKLPIEINSIKAMLSTEFDGVFTECFTGMQTNENMILLTKEKKSLDYRADSLEAMESNSPDRPQPPHEIIIFKSGFFSFNFIMRGYNG